MKPIHLILICLLILSKPVLAQEKHCATVLSDVQIAQLKKFQSKVDELKGVYKKAGIQYVPIQFHITGMNNGVGYFKIESVLQALCDINEDFAPTGFRFYLNGPIKYINNTDLYRGDIETIYNTIEQYKDQDAVNVFFQGTGNQWCGVYFPDVDVVFVLNRCQGTNATTLTHELGHFFGLPHTFYGWEGGGRPSEFFIEKLDGSNCRDAGDGFCDTKADYVSDRWGCPLSYQLQDPNGIFFKPDSSIYMSYSLDACQSRFSLEQQMYMQSNLNARNISADTANTETIAIPQLVYPTSADSNLNPKSVQLVWNKVPGAYAYHVQVARFASWEFLNFESLTTDTQALVTSLYGTWPYSWRVKAITRTQTCGEFSDEMSFTTKEIVSGIQDIRFENGFKFYPNPAEINRDIQLISKTDGILKVSDLSGKTILESEIKAGLENVIQIRKSGVFILQFINENGTYTSRVVCEE
ncbi:MAG: zinc-dependent metalloprotease [Bacteroidia bacterium]